MAGQRYSLLAFLAPTGQGVTDTYHVSLQAVAKCDQHCKYFVSNEHICGIIGRCIGLPLPPSGIIFAPSHHIKTWFASLNFNLSGNALPMVDTTACVSQLPDLSAGLIIFDILVANSDRHEKNFAVDFAANPPRMSVFDHSHALFGYDSSQGLNRLKQLRARLGISGGTFTSGNRHCLLDVIDSDLHFSKWFNRIRLIPDYLIEDACYGTVELGLLTNAEAKAAKDFLIYRRNNIRGLVKKHRPEFKSIKQWSLI